MRTVPKHIVFLVLLVGSHAAPAADPAPATLSADALVEEVLGRNPGIAELRAASAASAAAAEVAGAVDDPTLSYAFAPRTLAGEGRGLNQKIEISQLIPWPGTLQAREKAARASALAASAGVDALKLEVAAAARAYYAEWYFTHHAFDVHDAMQGLLEDMHAAISSQYAAGRAPLQAVLQVELEMARLERHHMLLTRRKNAAQASINALMNLPPDAPLLPPGVVHVPDTVTATSALYEQALASHPGLRGLRASADSTLAEITVAEKAMLPDLRLMAGYNGLMDDPDKRPIIGLSINVPLNRSKRKAELSRARWAAQRAELQLENQTANLRGQMAAAHASLLEAIRAVQVYEQRILPLAEDVLDAALDDYGSGRGDFETLIAAGQQRFQAAEELARSRADYIRAAGELQRWVGLAPGLVDGDIS